MDLAQIKKDRFLFLNKLYEDAQGSSDAAFDMYEIGEEVGFDDHLTSNIVTYLNDEGLTAHYGLGGVIRLTHDGIKEIEQAHENPASPTQHFAPVSYINIHSAGDGNVINTGNDNVFSISNSLNSGVVAHMAQEIMEVLKRESSVDEAVKAEAMLVLNELIAEAEKGKPSKQTMDKVLTIGSNISSIASLIISLFQLVYAS